MRVDSDVVDKLIVKGDEKGVDLDSAQRSILTGLFQNLLPRIDGANFIVSFEAMAEDTDPVVITTNEYMRRMKDMATLQPGMSFYSELPDSYNLVVNVSNPVVKRVTKTSCDALSASVTPILQNIDEDNKVLSELQKGNKGADAEHDQRVKDLEKKISDNREAMNKTIAEYAATADIAKQLVDLALLGNGLLKGSELSRFIKRSVSLL